MAARVASFTTAAPIGRGSRGEKGCIDPVVVNGDIRSFDDATHALAASGADAVMIGRAHKVVRGFQDSWRAISRLASATSRRRWPSN